jgi:hypothetical protein
MSVLEYASPPAKGGQTLRTAVHIAALADVIFFGVFLAAPDERGWQAVSMAAAVGFLLLCGFVLVGTLVSLARGGRSSRWCRAWLVFATAAVVFFVIGLCRTLL